MNSVFNEKDGQGRQKVLTLLGAMFENNVHIKIKQKISIRYI